MQEVSMGFSVLDTSASASTPLARFKHAVAAWQVCIPSIVTTSSSKLHRHDLIIMTSLS